MNLYIRHDEERRTFLRNLALYGSAALIAGHFLPNPARAAAATASSNARFRNTIGLELFTIGRLLGNNRAGWEPVMEALSKIGVREIEPASAFPNDMTPQQIRTMLDGYKITMISSHTAASGATMAEVEKSLADQQLMGIRYSDYNLGGGGPGGGRGGGTNIPSATPAQTQAAAALTAATAPLSQAVTDARNALAAASLKVPVSTDEIQAKLGDLVAAESKLATARADWLAKLQASSNKLSAEQIASVLAQNNPAAGRGGFGAPGGPGGPGGGRGGGTVAMQTVAQFEESGKRSGDNYNAKGKVMQKFGIKMHIHNHTNEFVKMTDTGLTQHDMQVRFTDPALVAMQLDIGWCYCAGVDALDQFKKYPGRYELWHVKDFTNVKLSTRTAPQGQQPQGSAIVPVGQGDIDYRPIFAAADLAGMKHWVIEQDGARGMDDVKSSCDHLLANVLV